MVVYADLAGTSHMVGRLWARIRKERESATFECEREIDRMASAFEHDDLRAALRLEAAGELRVQRARKAEKEVTRGQLRLAST